MTEFEFRLHPLGTRALVADVFFPAEDALPVLRGWQELNATAPRQATFTAWSGEATAPFLPEELWHRPLPGVGFVWVGDREQGRALLPAMRALGRPGAERIQEMSYVELQLMDDDIEGHRRRRYWKGHYFRELTDEAIDAFRFRGTADGRGALMPAFGLQAYGGAIAEVPDGDTAFSQRGTHFELVVAARWTDPAQDAARMATARRCAAALDPFATGVYVNALTDEGAAGVRRAYPPTKLTRLTALKDLYDPDNVFHLNQNIRPSSG